MQTDEFDGHVTVGGAVKVTTTSAVSVGQGPAIVHRSVTGPVPVRCVNTALGSFAFGEKLPVTPAVTMVQVPVLPAGTALPPRTSVVPNVQMVCGPPTVASTTVTTTSRLKFWQPPLIAAVTVYTPDIAGVTLVIDGFWRVDVKPLGPTQK